MRDYFEEILAIIQSDKSAEEIRDALDNYHENDIANVLCELEEKDRKKLYKILSEEKLSEIFSYLEDPSDFLKEMGLEKAADVLEEMDSDDAVDVLDELEDEHRDKILELMEPDAKEDIELIHSYDEEELGSKITTNFITVLRTDTVKMAMNEVVQEAAENDNVTIIYVLNEDETYYGTIDLRDLFIARATTPLEDIIKTSYPKFYAKDTTAEVYPLLKEYSLESYPVLDEKDHLIGVITSSDIIELLDDEMGDDYAKLAGLSGENELKDSIWKSVGKRLPWLLILLVLGMLISMVISSFEHVVAELPVVVFFQSLVLGMSGNVGTQSLAVTIRVLSDENVSKKDLWKVVFKEVRIGFLNGVLLAIVSFGVVGLFISITKLTIATNAPFSYSLAFMVSGIIGIALIAAMTLSAFFGSLIPIIFKKIHIDPAVASGPFITTVNDIVAVVVYYGLAWILILTVL